MKIEADSSDLERISLLLGGMLKHLDEFVAGPMSSEMREWQIEDMHRHYPEQTNPSADEVQTTIYPRSRKPRVYRPKRRLVGVKRRMTAAMPLRRGSHRPILRDELFTRLCERMDTLIQRELTWR